MAVRQDASTGELVAEGQPAPAPQTPDKGPVDQHGRPVMHVKVYSPYNTYFDADAYSISAKNKTGPFDILPRHHRFITLLDAGDLQVDSLENGEVKILIAGGLMHVKSDQVRVFLQI